MGYDELVKSLHSIKALLRTRPHSLADKQQQTRTLSLLEACFESLMKGTGEFYIIPFALFLGAGNVMMGFLGTAPVLVMALAQLLGGTLIDRLQRRKGLLVVSCTIQGLLFLPLFSLPLSLSQGKIAVLLICVVAYYLASGITLPPWMSMMGDVVPADQRGHFFHNAHASPPCV